MKAVVQRVISANLKVEGQLISEINNGYVVFLGVKKGDTEKNADYFIKKLPTLRIFEDENGKINKSIIDTNGEILLVSQFTLYANTSHGNRPDFLHAAPRELAIELYEVFNNELRGHGLEVKEGFFGEEMVVSLVNHGPFTLVLET